MSIGKRLKEERKRLKYNQVALSGITGTHSVTISNYEKDKICPPSSFLEKLDLLGFDVQYMITGRRSGEISSMYNLEERLLVDTFRQADTSIQKAIKALLSTVPMPSSTLETLTPKNCQNTKHIISINDSSNCMNNVIIK